MFGRSGDEEDEEQNEGKQDYEDEVVQERTYRDEGEEL